MLATPDMSDSTAFLGQLGFLAVMMGVLVWLAGRALFRAGLHSGEDPHHQIVVRWIGWGAAVLTVGAMTAAVGLVLLALMVLVLAQ